MDRNDDQNRIDGNSDARDSVVSIPRQLGRYQLTLPVASGGMAEVHLARVEGEAGFEKVVAVKTIHPHLVDSGSFVTMFLDEARIASQIDHPNVCTVFDFGREASTYYLAMEYLVGESLSAVMDALTASESDAAREELPFFAARIIADACEGLHAAHETKAADATPLDIVHRDVSPHNLFVLYSGSVKIVDFGIAKAAQRTQHTVAGSIKGKVSYMAPEQIESKPTDRRVDVWGLGVCLWELLTLNRLFDRETDAANMMAVLNQEIVLPSQRAEHVPPSLDEIVGRALQRQPENRFSTAREMGRALRHWITESGKTIDMAELSDWMDRLFAEGRVEHEKLVELARTRSDLHLSGPEAVATSSDATTITPSRDDLVSQQTTVVGSALGALGRWSSHDVTQWVAAGLAAAALLIALVVLVSNRGSGGSSETVVVEVPAHLPAQVPAVEVASPESDLGGDVNSSAAKPEPLPKVTTTRKSSRSVEKRKPATSTRRSTRRTPSRSASQRAKAAAAAKAEKLGRLGTLRIAPDSGWAKVLIDGESYGRTPILVDLPPGVYEVVLMPSGKQPTQRREVKLKPGRETVLRQSFDR